MHHINCAYSVARRQHAIEGGRRTAALNVPEHDRTSFKAGALLNLARQDVTDSAQAHMTELVFCYGGHDRCIVLAIAFAREFCALGDHYDAEVSPARVAPSQALGNVVDVKGTLGNQDDISTAGDAAVNRDPARVAAHDFNHHDPVVGFRGGVHTVDSFSRNADGGIETKTEISAAEVVIDGLGYTDDLYAALVQLHGNRLSIIAANRNQHLNPIVLQVFDTAFNATLTFCGVGARTAEDSAAARQDTGDRLQIKWHGHIFEHAAPAFQKANEFILVMKDALAHHRPDDRIQSRAIASPSENSDLHSTPRIILLKVGELL